MMANVRVALIATIIFGSVCLTSGRIRESDGLGYDGVVYAQMVSDGLDAGFPNARVRPLVLLINRAVHETLHTDILTTFVVTNIVFMFLLALGLALLLEHYGAPEPVRAIFAANIALSIATAQMFAYYPVLVDLGALAFLVIASYCAVAAPWWVTAIAATAAVACREFGMAAVLFGVHRELRLRRPLRAVLAYAPAVVVFLAIRWYVQATAAHDAGPEGEMLTATELLGNALLWFKPVFVLFFLYFLVTVFGGISACLLVRVRKVIHATRQNHELLSLAVPVLGLAAIGSADIWRYLVYLLPAAAILFAVVTRDSPRVVWTLVALTLFTILTQRPWHEVTEDVYFSHWFPYYAWLNDEPIPASMFLEWARRLALTVTGLLLLRAATVTDERVPEPARTYHVRR